MARSLNKVQLIGNLTRDPELRYTPQGAAVCSFGLATNRRWKTDSGDLRDEAEFHRIVVWNQLAEICSRMLGKGKRVYVEGRLQTRTWTGSDGQQRTTTEIVISDMIVFSPRQPVDADLPKDLGEDLGEEKEKIVAPKAKSPSRKKSKKVKKAKTKKGKGETKKGKGEKGEDIPF